MHRKMFARYRDHHFRNDTFIMKHLIDVEVDVTEKLKRMINLLSMNSYLNELYGNLKASREPIDCLRTVIESYLSVQEHSTVKQVYHTSTLSGKIKMNANLVKFIIGLIFDHCFHSCIVCFIHDNQQFELHVLPNQTIYIAFNYCVNNSLVMLDDDLVNGLMIERTHISSHWPDDHLAFSIIHYFRTLNNGFPKVYVHKLEKQNQIVFQINLSATEEMNMTTIPRAIIENKGSHICMRHETSNTATSASTQMIVLVDDNAIVLQVLKGLLRPLDKKLVALDNSTDALNYILLNLKNIQCILLDLQMPVLSGKDIIGRLMTVERLMQSYSNNGPINNILDRIIIVSASDEEKRYCLDVLKVRDFLSKPVTGEALLSAVEKVIGSSHHH